MNNDTRIEVVIELYGGNTDELLQAIEWHLRDRHFTEALGVKEVKSVRLVPATP